MTEQELLAELFSGDAIANRARFEAEDATHAAKEAAEKAAYKASRCPKCAGSGFLSHFSHIKAGECFRCHGTGSKHAHLG